MEAVKVLMANGIAKNVAYDMLEPADEDEMADEIAFETLAS